MVTTFNLFTSISWIIAGVVSAVLSLMFLAKNPKRRLNQLFSAGFILWSFTMIFTGMVFAVAYRSLTAANILRDIAVISGIVGGFVLFAASIGIYFGPESLNWILYLSILIVAGVVSGFGAANDWVTTDGTGGFKTTDNLTGKICIQIVNSVFVIVALVFLILTQRASTNPLAKKRVGYFTIGYATILIGMAMFLIDGILDMFVTLTPYLFPVFGLLTWVMGPVLILIGFSLKADSERSSGKETIIKTESRLLKAKQEQTMQKI